MRTVAKVAATHVFLIALLGVWVGCSGPSPAATSSEQQRISPSSPFTFEGYDAVARTYVDDHGMVDYAGLLKADKEGLDSFLEAAAQLDGAVYEAWPGEMKIAFWINVYNGLTLKAILDHYPIQVSALKSFLYPKNSIRQIRGVWYKLEWTVMGRKMTLNDIEHETLRKDFDEPRIHAALVCAAMGCPPLRNEAYTAAALDMQLDDQMTRFLAQPNKFRIDRESYTVHLSKIFQWYGADFIKSHGTVDAFKGHNDDKRAVLNAVSQYVSEEDRAYLATATYNIEYLDYDWTLNEQAAR